MAFPTDYPEDIRKIFGREYFSQVIEPESEAEFWETIQYTNTEAVVTFNKGVFNFVSEGSVERYVQQLIEGELIQSNIKDTDKYIPVFLTFPTGWFYHKQYRQLRKSNLDAIKAVILSNPSVPK